jgi:hypothetical protein
MVLVLLLVLAAVPLLGVLWIAVYGSLTTVDGLFMSLILLAMSGILGPTALFELRRRASGQGAVQGSSGRLTSQGLMRSGKVQEVTFFEANVGEPNKSIVTLSGGGSESQTLVLDGDVRNALPVGQKVQITLRKEAGQNVLVNVSYS